MFILYLVAPRSKEQYTCRNPCQPNLCMNGGTCQKLGSKESPHKPKPGEAKSSKRSLTKRMRTNRKLRDRSGVSVPIQWRSKSTRDLDSKLNLDKLSRKMSAASHKTDRSLLRSIIHSNQVFDEQFICHCMTGYTGTLCENLDRRYLVRNL